MPHNDPAGLPGLAALAVGFLVFFITLAMARSRSDRAEKRTADRTRRTSWFWVAVQGLGIGSVGFGAVAVTLDPLSARALGAGAVVLVLMLFAVWLFDWSSRTMGRNWSVVARTREDHTLVTSGPFAYVRHPIYSALFLFMVAMAIGYGHWRHLAIGVPFYALGTWMRIRHEERLLHDAFGDAYLAYAARVKRFVPGVF